MIAEKTDWKQRAKGMLKAELARRNLRYEDLTLLLNSDGAEETVDSIRTKVNRGSFSHAFFLHCMQVLGCEVNIKN